MALRLPSVPAPTVLRLFTGCLTVFIVEQSVNNRRTDGAESERIHGGCSEKGAAFRETEGLFYLLRYLNI